MSTALQAQGAEATDRAANAPLDVAPVAHLGGAGFFAADPAMGEFNTHSTLDAAREDAKAMLDSASDEAADSGWQDEPPQICYGVIVGECFEKNRRPMTDEEAQLYGLDGAQDGADMIDFELRESAACPAEAAQHDPQAAARIVGDLMRSDGFTTTADSVESIVRRILEKREAT